MSLRQPASATPPPGVLLERPVPPRHRRLRAPLATAAVVGLASLALHVRDPHVQGSWGLCPMSAVLGVYCPGCGGLRAVNDLGHGDLAAAVSSNALFVLSIPLLVLIWARWTARAWTGEAVEVDGRRALVGTAVLGVLALAFAVARNLPGSWLAP